MDPGDSSVALPWYRTIKRIGQANFNEHDGDSQNDSTIQMRTLVPFRTAGVQIPISQSDDSESIEQAEISHAHNWPVP